MSISNAIKTSRPALIIITMIVAACHQQPATSKNIGPGTMPNLAADKSGSVYIVYGRSDSILCSHSADAGKVFSAPELVGVLPDLVDYSMRGPQVALLANGVLVTACSRQGDIFSFSKDGSGRWSKRGKVNDIDTVAKEGLMALAADGDHAFAVWLDLRNNKRNKIAGAISYNGGKTWLANTIVYQSPDTTVCECCKPSVVMRGSNVYVLFRNKLNGSRDLYIISSVDGGKTFGDARKLGSKSWQLNGCPMDGGGMALNKANSIETVWRRNDSVFTCRSGDEEKMVAKGKNCTLESVDGKNVYAWTTDGEVIVKKPGGDIIHLGKGQLPLIKQIGNDDVLCVWEKDKQVMVQPISL